MPFISTRAGTPAVSFREALLDGLARDGGLFVPDTIAPLPPGEIQSLRGASLSDTAVAVCERLLQGEIARADLTRLLAAALDFPIPLVTLNPSLSVLELFHGPTFAFKDVGARVMARLMAYFHDDGAPLTVLVATSGDTGSAVAQAFFGVPGTRVVVLFPEGQVTDVQEAQFATLGRNVRAVAVDGTFDDCQRLAKQAFADAGLRARARLTSANSINIGRLLPQMIYYFTAALAVPPDAAAIVSVPSGNFGNLTAGLFAQRLGAPIARFVAATTVNDTVPRYLATGRYEPRPSISTVANAMDVGDPSNFERMEWLFGGSLDAMREAVTAVAFSDDQVRAAIAELDRQYGYVADPHTAIAYLGAEQAARTPSRPSLPSRPSAIFLATAHPAKFREVVEPAIGRPVPLPPALAAAVARPRQVVRIGPRLSELIRLLDG